MPLIPLWKSNPSAIGETTIEQIVAIAGDGNLRDGNECSQELRQYFSEIPSAKLAAYIDHCLSSGFSKSGLVLQDLINELGRRLDYKVENGRYQGSTNVIGFDGVWIAPDNHAVIAEVKTTDAYRISLDTLIAYRQKLFYEKRIGASSSILIVVGREDTGELEAQIRGSRHAWDIRLISADALLKLVQLKENSDSPDTGQKIRSLLTPLEYTRLDNMIDVMFTTAKDVESAIVEGGLDKEHSNDVADNSQTAKGIWEFTDIAILDAKRSEIIDALASKLGTKLVKKSRALFWDAEHTLRVACSISKRYTKRTSYPYWYAYHPQWDDFLNEGSDAYFVLGCMDLSIAFALPLKLLRKNLQLLNTTTTERSTYWHIHLVETDKGYAVLLPKGSQNLSVDEYRIELKDTK